MAVRKNSKNSTNDQSQCRWCVNPIDINARVCEKCGKYQSLIWSSLQQISHVGIILSFIAVGFTGYATYQTNEERVKAEAAVNEVKRVKTEVLELSKNLGSLLNNVETIVETQNKAFLVNNTLFVTNGVSQISNVCSKKNSTSACQKHVSLLSGVITVVLENEHLSDLMRSAHCSVARDLISSIERHTDILPEQLQQVTLSTCGKISSNNPDIK